MGTKRYITQEELKSKLCYDPLTGVFTWIARNTNKTKPGDQVGCLDGAGCVNIWVHGKSYRAHRLAFLWIEGYFPENEVDHINRNKADNRWCNLREVSTQCNSRNRGVRKTNSSGVTGVYPHGKLSKWVSQITENGKSHFLGQFKNFEDAVKARWEAEKKYGFPNCNTTSSAYEYLIKTMAFKEALKK